MKTFKLNNVEINIDEIQKLIKDNPEIFKKKEAGEYFFPKVGDEYWYIKTNGCASMGVYRTQEQSDLARDKQKAIVACWKWAQENVPFEPDWSDERQCKWSALYTESDDVFTHWACRLTKIQFTLPYFKTEKDCTAFMNANREHLKLLFSN